MRPEQIPYGVKDFKRIRLENRYYVDKTAYIRELEKRADFLFFVRPRRFGKTLLCETLKCYYDVAEKGNFQKLFGGLAIGRDPTDKANRYFVLLLDFSQVNASTGKTWSDKFESYLNNALRNLIDEHRDQLSAVADVDQLIALHGAGDKFEVLVPLIRKCGFGLYVIVDEYDNFTNEIVSSIGTDEYRSITHGTAKACGVPGFYYSFYSGSSVTNLGAVAAEGGRNVLCGPSKDVEFSGVVKPDAAAGFFSIGAKETPGVQPSDRSGRPDTADVQHD